MTFTGTGITNWFPGEADNFILITVLSANAAERSSHNDVVHPTDGREDNRNVISTDTVRDAFLRRRAGVLRQLRSLVTTPVDSQRRAPAASTALRAAAFAAVRPPLAPPKLKMR